MSHITDIRLCVMDLDALEEAGRACGLVMDRAATEQHWWGAFVGDSRSYGQLDPKTFGKGCVATLKEVGTTPQNGPGGPWDIGVYPAPDGRGYVVGYDSYGGAGRRLEQLAGQGLWKLKQEYAAAVTLKKAKAKLAIKGFVAQRTTLPSGRVRIELVRR